MNAPFPARAGAILLSLARIGLEEAVTSHALGTPVRPVAQWLHLEDALTLSHEEKQWLQQPEATFVTLTIDGDLRGCIGTLEAHRPLYEDVAANASAAAVHDPRFVPVRPGELAQIRVEVSVLSAAQPLPATSRVEALRSLRPGVDGVILRDGHHRATFLPQVWEQLRQPQEFLSHLCLKAGLPASHWGEHTRLETYTVTAFHEGEAG